ncbi:SNF2 family N-terminal domain-containing protein [Macrophomina phaseolina]|uniref:SNF2 family N-terminal domain-containing protein n=1 Tax=Macrophomina phaseolina TaxID=35725 RepID=A0ABQ8GSI4_9PEZI|nr:SNF2 family N-terminal domain-containing protein [Macrophomina phaseolina]
MCSSSSSNSTATFHLSPNNTMTDTTKVKEEDGEPAIIKPWNSDGEGANFDTPILLDDDDDADAQLPAESHPTADAPEVKTQITALAFTPSSRTERRGKEHFRLLRKRLREGFSNEGYSPGLSNNAPQDPCPSQQTFFDQVQTEHEAPIAEGQSDLDREMRELWREQAQSDMQRRANQEARQEEEEYESELSESDDNALFVNPEPRLRKSQWPRGDQLNDHEQDIFDVGEGPSRHKEMEDEIKEMEAEIRTALEEKRTRKRKAGDSKKCGKKREGKKSARKKRKRDAQEPGDVRRQALGAMMPTDVFRDAAATRNAPDLPDIRETKKQAALTKLLQSVPRENRKQAMGDKREMIEASKAFAPQPARPDGDGGWKITGMATSLKNYQMIGGGFMRKREKDDQKPHGGICADAMGLGKTVTMIANIVNSRPKRPIPEEPKTTLIVLPASLVTQWADELQRHVNPKLKLRVLTYRAGSRPEINDVPAFLARFDVVLTTYYEVQRSYPKTVVPLDRQTSEEKSAWWKEFFETHKGDLHKVEWKRVVLDEAQQIKNYRSRTSLACRALKGKYRWALSGTPILNSPLELYPYFKFLEVPWTGSFRIFKENYYKTGSHEEPLERLSLMTSRFMIRRTHKDTMFGAPILKLPKASERIHWVKFNDLERGNLRDRPPAHGNILMIEVVMKDLLEREDHEKIRELTQIEVPRHDSRRGQLIELRRLLADPVVSGDAADEPKDGNTPATTRSSEPHNRLRDLPDGDIDIGGAHGRKFNFAKYLKDLRTGERWEELRERTLCVVCHENPEEPYVTACYHIYCRECLELHQHECAKDGMDYTRCRRCQIEYTWAHPCDEFELDSIISDAEDAEINATAAPVNRWRKRMKKNKGKRRRGDDVEITRTWIERHGTVLPSAKTVAIKAQILNWLEDDPACKILVYTQFISMIQILKKICDTEGWSKQEYSGRMSIQARDKALENFKRNNVSILLASLKCGGLGLNLTEAKHVISVDPWWNWALEQQAFCRVFRIGQQEETSMTRFVVEGTIDEKLIDMQDRKQAEIDQVMGDTGQLRENLSMNDMMRLFGQVGEDGEGHPFIMVEDKDTLPRFNADSEDEGDEE